MAKKSNRGAANDIALMATSGGGSDLDTWLNQQGISAEETATTVTAPVVATVQKSAAPTGTSVTDGVAEPVQENVAVEPKQVEVREDVPASTPPVATGKTGKQRDRYEGQFFRRIEGFKKPTNMMYMSEKTYKLLAFLLRCSKENNTKITMPEIMENIINQHIRDNDIVLTQMQQEHLERLSKGF